MSSTVHTGDPTVTSRPPVTLSIAGTDPSGGAGIQADLKTFTARATLGTSVITSLVAQNTHGVTRIYPIAEDFVRDQFTSVLEDMPVDATKTGMLGSQAMVAQLIQQRQTQDFGFFTVDPVMVSTSGHRLLAADAVAKIRHELLPLTDLITPNLTEAALLLGQTESEAQTVSQMEQQARALIQRGARAVLLKGGHTSTDSIVDVLMTRDGLCQHFHQQRIHTANTHGTGCTLSAAITADIATLKHSAGVSSASDVMLCQAVTSALAYLSRALSSAAGWCVSLEPDNAHGPVDHQVDIKPVA